MSTVLDSIEYSYQDQYTKQWEDDTNKFYSNREENTDVGDSSPGNVIGRAEKTENNLNMSPHSTVIFVKDQTRLWPLQWKTRRRIKVRQPWRKIPTGEMIQKPKLRPRRIKQQTMDWLSYSSPELAITPPQGKKHNRF